MLVVRIFMVGICMADLGNAAAADEPQVAPVGWEQVHARSRVEPEYPPDVTGLPLPAFVHCRVEFQIDRTGVPTGTDVQEPCPAPFRESALAVAPQWRFYPYREDGQPLEARFILDIAYKTPRQYVDLERSAWSWDDIDAHLRKRAKRAQRVATPLSVVGVSSFLVGGGSLVVGLTRSLSGEPAQKAYTIGGIVLGASLPIMLIGGGYGERASRAQALADNWNSERWADMQAGFGAEPSR